MSVRIMAYGDKLDLADELEEQFRKDAVAVVREGTDMAVAEVKANLRRTGARVSEPGQTPGTQSGDLERSISRGSVRLGRDKRSVAGQVVSSQSYEEVNSVEYGHVKPEGVRVLPRPFLRRAMAAVEPKIEALFGERL